MTATPTPEPAAVAAGAATTATVMPAEEKLGTGTKVAFGFGDFGTAIVAGLMSFFLLFFLTDVARLHPAAAGSILLITKVWDAVNDPIVGWLSDRTQTRWGRRRPWLLFGALPFGLLLFLMWIVPPFGPVGLYAYYVLVGLLMDTVYTVVNVPYTALTPELTRDYDERTSLNSYRIGFSVLGSLAAAVLHPVIVGRFADVRTGYVVAAAFWAVICTVPPLVVFGATRERPEHEPQPGAAELPLAQQLRIAFANRPYRFVIALYLFSWLALQLVATVMVYYMTYYMRRPALLPVVLAAIQVTSLAFVFVWTALSRRLDKRMVYLIGATIWMLVMIGVYFVQPGQMWLLLPLAMLAGVGVATAYLIPWSMMPDVIEFDEWETGQRREGIFYGFMVLLQKSGIALAIWLVGMALAQAGYITPSAAVAQPDQPLRALQAIRIFIGPVPALILACSLVVAYFYPISRRVHTEMRAALAARGAVQVPGPPA